MSFTFAGGAAKPAAAAAAAASPVVSIGLDLTAPMQPQTIAGRIPHGKESSNLGTIGFDTFLIKNNRWLYNTISQFESLFDLGPFVCGKYSNTITKERYQRLRYGWYDDEVVLLANQNKYWNHFPWVQAFHLTTVDTARKILGGRGIFLCGSNGLKGAGIYFAPRPTDCFFKINKGAAGVNLSTDMALIEVDLLMGNPYVSNGRAEDLMHVLASNKYDSVIAQRTGGIEYIVYHAAQVAVKKVYIMRGNVPQLQTQSWKHTRDFSLLNPYIKDVWLIDPALNTALVNRMPSCLYIHQTCPFYTLGSNAHLINFVHPADGENIDNNTANGKVSTFNLLGKKGKKTKKSKIKAKQKKRESKAKKEKVKQKKRK
jgi:hypothetical protein